MSVRSRIGRNRIGPRGQGGIAVMDLILYAIAISGGLAFLFWLGSIAFSKSAVQTEAQNFQMMSGDTRAAYGKSQGNFTGVSAAQLIMHNLVPRKMVSGTTIQTGWNTPVTPAPASLNGTAGDAVAWTYNVPRTDCSEFITMVSGSIARATIGGTAVLDVPNGVSTLNMTAVGTACNASAGTGNVVLVMTTGR